MSEAADTQGPRPQEGAAPYDLLGLRRGIAVSFTLPELKALAQELGVGESIAWEHGTNAAARDLTAQFERYYGLATLVAKLRQVRPLVDWAEPAGEAPAVDVGAAAAASGELAEVVEVGEVGDAKAPIAPTAEPAPVPPPPRVLPATPIWAAVSPAAPERGVDPNVLILVASLTVLAAIIAYVAGRASNGTAASTPAAPSASASARGSDGIAARVTQALGKSLRAVARECELPASVPVDARVLSLATERCGGPQQRLRTRSTAPEPWDEPTPTDAPADAAEAAPKRARARAAGAKDAPAEGVRGAAASGGCVGGCNAEHLACKQRCGTEPSESSGYDAYQLCRGRCLAGNSRCRLGCE